MTDADGIKRTIPLFTDKTASEQQAAQLQKEIELAKAGKTTSEIGLILRDQYAVPDVKLATGKKISKILEGNNIKPEIPEDMRNLIGTALSLRKHLETNTKDLHNKRNLHLTESKIRRLTKYYQAEGRLPQDWKYSPTQAKLMFE